MMTLKDIKVSKNRIPVQNALWIRPMGGLTFKVYYPHGGDWAEMKVDGSASGDYQEEIDSLNTRVGNVESSIEDVNTDLNSLNKKTELALSSISRLRTEMDIESNEVSITIGNILRQINYELIFTQDLPLELTQYDEEIYGVGVYEFGFIVEGTVTKARMPSYDVPLAVMSSTGSGIYPGYPLYFIYDVEGGRVVYQIEKRRGPIYQGKPISFLYFASGQEETYDENTLVFTYPLAKFPAITVAEDPDDFENSMSAEEAAQYGLTESMFEDVDQYTAVRIVEDYRAYTITLDEVISEEVDGEDWDLYYFLLDGEGIEYTIYQWKKDDIVRYNVSFEILTEQ